MLVMALDHVRDLMHIPAPTQDPVNLATTTPVLFFTRFVTHFCAPTFVFLAGVSAYISLQQTNETTSRRFLISRGIWLIFLELTVISFGIWWDIHFNIFLFQVIGAIGVGMVILGLLIKLPTKVLGTIGLLIIIFHQLYTFIPFKAGSMSSVIANPFFNQAFINLSANKILIIAYPIIPWLGVLLAGFGVGTLFLQTEEKRRKTFLKTGVLLLIFFVVLRLTNWYGDPAAWGHQKNGMFTFLSFLNVSKYPPSLLYVSLTLGVMFLLLYLAELIPQKLGRIFLVYGKVPLFYYLVHWYIVHTSLFIVLFAQGFTAADFRFGFFFGRPEAPCGVNLLGVYLIWIAIITALYPLCKWYGGYKFRNKEQWWLRYL